MVVANMVPLFGALFFGWSLAHVVFLYWSENVVIGIFNIAKMQRAVGPAVDTSGKPFMPEMKKSLIAGFILTYGLFTFVHGLFAGVLFGRIDGSNAQQLSLAFFLLFVSHGVSYVTNFLGKEEYKRVSAPELFAHPFKRVIVMHLAVIFGGALVQLLRFPLGAPIILIFLKTFIDLKVHSWEHQKFGDTTPTSVEVQPAKNVA